MLRRTSLMVGVFALAVAPAASVRGDVVKDDSGGQISWSDDFLRSGGAVFLDLQQQLDYCNIGPPDHLRPQYTALDPVNAGGYNSASVTVGNGVMGVNHDEFQPTDLLIPINIAAAIIGWYNQTGNCVGGSLIDEHDAPFDDNDICFYGGVRFNAWHLKTRPIDYGPWGPDGKSGYADVDDDGDGTTDHGKNYVAVGGYNQAVNGTSNYNCCDADDEPGDTCFGASTPDQMDVTGSYDDTMNAGCANRFPRVERYILQVVKEGPYPNNGLDDDLDGTVDNEEPWEATIYRECSASFLLPTNGTDDDGDGITDEAGEAGIFASGVSYPLDAGLSIVFTDTPPGTAMELGCDGRWDIEIWPAQSYNALVNNQVPSYAEEIYGRNRRWNSERPASETDGAVGVDDDGDGETDEAGDGYVNPHGPDGKAGIAGVDDDGNGVTDEFPTVGRPDTDDDGDGVTDEFDEVVLDELSERNEGDDADDTMGRGSFGFALRTDIQIGSYIILNIDPGSGGGNLFSIRDIVGFAGEQSVDESDEIGPGFYQPGVKYGFAWCTSGSCYGAQLWIGNDGGNPVETVGPASTNAHTGTECALAAGQFGSGLVSLMERWPLVTNPMFDDKFWAIEGTIKKPTVTVLQDRDRDGDVDGVDFSVFASCFNKAGNPPRTLGCTVLDADAFDTDDDGDVDGVDFSVFASCFNKAGNPPRASGCYVETSSLTACP